MKKKIIIFIICIILVVFLCGVVFFYKDKKSDKTESSDKYSVILDKEGNIIYDMSKNDETTEVIKNTVIQGIVELNHNGYIYIFNGQHFGEFGLEMKEYTRANINNKNQKCLDYFTLKEYDTNYIIGNLQREKNVKVQYENSNAPLDGLKIKSIEVIED